LPTWLGADSTIWWSTLRPARETNRCRLPNWLAPRPGWDVGEVYEALRKDPELDALKVCAITGRPELRRLIYQRSVRPPEGFLTNPVTEASLLLAVRKCLELSD